MTDLIKSTASTYYFRAPEFGWAKVVVCPEGDLFITSDYGYYCYSWRAFGNDFKNFLMEISADYAFTKFDTNAHYLFKKGLPRHVEKPVSAIMLALQGILKEELNEVPA